MQEFPEELHTAFPLQNAHLICPPFSALFFGKNVLKICLDLKSFRCRGCNQHPEIWNGTRQCSVQWPGKKSTWLRGACRGQVVSALPCSKPSSFFLKHLWQTWVYPILKKSSVREILLPPEANSSCMHLLFSVAYWEVTALRSWTGLNPQDPQSDSSCHEDSFCLHWNILFGICMGLDSNVQYNPWIWPQYGKGAPVILSPKYLQGKIMSGEFLQIPVKSRLPGLLDIWLHGGEPVSPVKFIFWALPWVVLASWWKGRGVYIARLNQTNVLLLNMQIIECIFIEP